MIYDITSRFFHWMEANNITRSEAAEKLGVDERSLSTYRSRGLPRKKEARAEQIMSEHRTAGMLTPGIDQTTSIRVSFSDEEYEMVEQAAKIVGSTTTEFIQKAATFKAKEQIAAEATPLSLVAEDPTSYHTKKNGTEGNE